MKIPEYLKKAMLDLKNCEVYGAEDQYAEVFFLVLNEAFQKKDITEETKQILLKNSENNFKNFEI